MGTTLLCKDKARGADTTHRESADKKRKKYYVDPSERGAKYTVMKDPPGTQVNRYFSAGPAAIEHGRRQPRQEHLRCARQRLVADLLVRHPAAASSRRLTTAPPSPRAARCESDPLRVLR